MKKQGFTLVELLAVIVILGILLIIAVPKINNVIDNAQKGAYKSTNSVIVSELRRQNGLEITPQVYTFTDGIMSPDIGITGELPKSGTVEVNSLGQIQVVTSNDKFCAIKRFDEDNVAVFDAGDRKCNVIVEITLTVNPNEGIYEGSTSNTIYSMPTEDFQTINDPTREGYTFDGWTIEGEGTYSSWLFQSGFTDATLTAKWKIWPTLTINLGGGTTTQTFNERYKSGTTFELITPSRTGYVFNGWEITGGDSELVTINIVTGESDSTLTANWLYYPTLNVVLGSGATTTQIFDERYLNGSNISLVEPVRSGYVFSHWSLNSTDATLSANELQMRTSNTILTANWLSYESMYTYTGSSTVLNDGSGNWRIKFLTSGTLTPLVDLKIDAFLVGGGGGGAKTTVQAYSAGSGAGGYTRTVSYISLAKNTEYPIVIGGGGARTTAGGATTGFGQTASGGGAGVMSGTRCCAAGGTGGSGGGNDCYGSVTDGATRTTCGGGSGQGTTTKEFGESSGTLYSSGGAYPGYCGAANTGNGGGGVNTGWHTDNCGGLGGSGIVVIRNTKIDQVGNATKYKFSYSGSYVVEDKDTDNWKIRFLSSGTFIPFSNISVSSFLVGGGGGGAITSVQAYSAGSGAGGYTKTIASTNIIANTSYSIIVGAGGTRGTVGGNTSAFGQTSSGGGAGVMSGTRCCAAGGSGGSGGGNDCYDSVTDGATRTTCGGGAGQGTTTREFGDPSGPLYSSGGSYPAFCGGANTGNGGGGVNTGWHPDNCGGLGGSGIVIIRPN